MMDFFNNQMNMAGMVTGEGQAIISSQVNLDKNFAFLEVQTFTKLYHCFLINFFCSVYVL